MKPRGLVFFFLFLIFQLFPIKADSGSYKKRVGFVPLVNAEGDVRYNALRDAVNGTLELTFGIITPLSFLKVEEFDPYGESARIKGIAEERTLDYLIFGRVVGGTLREIFIQVSVYDKEKNGVTISREEKARGIFDVFRAAERMSRGLVQDLLGVPIGFGGVELTNTGEAGDYDLYIDGEYMGKNTRTVPRLFNGERFIEVRQKRMLSEVGLMSRGVEVPTDGISRVEFAVPYLLEEERALLLKLEGEIEGTKELRGEEMRTLGAFGELIRLLGDVSYSRRLEEERERFRQMDAEYRLKAITWEIEDTFFEPGEATFNKLVPIYEQRRTYRDAALLESKVVENAQYLFSILDLHATRDLSTGNWEDGVNRYRYMERIADTLPTVKSQTFDEEKKVVFRAWKKYAKRNDRNEALAEIGIGVQIGKHLKDKFEASKKFFKEESGREERDLIILTNPPGVEVVVNNKNYGISPVRIKKPKGEKVRVSVNNPWFSYDDDAVGLKSGRTILFLNCTAKEVLRVHPVERAEKNAYRLSWSGLELVKGYTVQVDAAEGGFSKPIFQVEGIKKNEVIMKKRLKEGGVYVYRVQAVSMDRVKSGWSYSEPFVSRK